MENGIIVGCVMKVKGLMIELRDQSEKIKTLILDKGKTDENQ
ncbi:hypothetical protein [Bacillus sp. OK048]|nr:hypothetical protein [Bacillus sp. OK048]